MTSEGSNLRDLARRWSKNKSIKPGVYNCLMTIADRIDAEMVELPKDADGAPIHIGDTVYAHGFPDGNGGATCKVCSIEFNEGRESRIELDAGGVVTYRTPSSLTHDFPDSWDSIAHDIETSKGTVLISEKTLDGWADRIRKLAEKEDKR